MSKQQRMWATTAVVLGVGTMLGGCTSGNNFRDVEGVASKDPDLLEAYNNLDGHPNIAKVCIDGVAFATTTRDAAAAIQRVEAWDSTCPGGAEGD